MVNNRDIHFDTMIGHHLRNNSVFSRCLPFSKWLPKHGIKKSAVKIQYCPISKFDMWVDNDVPTLNNFYRLPFSKWPPQYRTNSTLSDYNDISYVGRLWCPELIPDIEKFLPVFIFKMVTTIPQNSTLFDFKGSFWFIYGHFVSCWFAVYS
jgi:hypothetical protein